MFTESAKGEKANFYRPQTYMQMQFGGNSSAHGATKRITKRICLLSLYLRMRQFARSILRYFLQGIIIISPIAATVWAAYAIFDFIDTKIPYVPRGIGFLSVIGALILIGWLGSTFFIWKFLIDVFDNLLERTPFLKFIYTSVKEVVESFMGDKRKFTKPVLVKVRASPELFQIGFITQNDLSSLGMHDSLVVYMPHSYAVSGVTVIVNKENVIPFNINPSDAMKMAVSGGVAGYNEEEEEK